MDTRYFQSGGNCNACTVYLTERGRHWSPWKCPHLSSCCPSDSSGWVRLQTKTEGVQHPVSYDSLCRYPNCLIFQQVCNKYESQAVIALGKWNDCGRGRTFFCYSPQICPGSSSPEEAKEMANGNRRWDKKKKGKGRSAMNFCRGLQQLLSLFVSVLQLLSDCFSNSKDWDKSTSCIFYI